MLSPSSGNTVIKSKLIGRRMFLLTAAKAIVTFGIIGRLVSLQINERTKAIMSVDIGGHPADTKRINEVAKQFNLKVITKRRKYLLDLKFESLNSR